MAIRAPKVGGSKTPRVPVPRNNPMGRVRPPLGMPHVAPPRIRPVRGNRQYGKTSAQQAFADPSQAGGQYANSGFGSTGMNGES